MYLSILTIQPLERRRRIGVQRRCRQTTPSIKNQPADNLWHETRPVWCAPMWTGEVINTQHGREGRIINMKWVVGLAFIYIEIKQSNSWYWWVRLPQPSSRWCGDDVLVCRDKDGDQCQLSTINPMRPSSVIRRWIGGTISPAYSGVEIQRSNS